MAKKKIVLDIPLNRVEGDLDIRVAIEDGVIVDAKSIGTMYRGFENILRDRAAMDSLVITPRICGICSITHLNAAVDALEQAQGITPPAQAVRLRNLSLISETLQSDIRQFFLMYMGDFANDFYKDSSFYKEAKEQYEPFRGEGVKDALKISTQILKVVAIIGGQWPHTSHMVPGGISTIPTMLELSIAQNHIEEFIGWYEKRVIGTSIDEFAALGNVSDYLDHLECNPKTDIARFTNYAQEVGLFDLGFTYPNFLSYGTIVNPDKPSERLVRSGVILDGKYEALDTAKIAEDISHGWYKQSRVLQNPQDGVTQPDMNNSDGYTWSKAPRYAHNVMQTGPLAQALVNQNPLITALYAEYKDCAYVRELARVLRPVVYLQYAREQIADSLKKFDSPSFEQHPTNFTGSGVGLVEAARGALGHWINIEDGKIKNYQIITPTAWNGSPKDKEGNLGAWEKSLIGVQCKNIDNPMEMGHIIRSFDPCLVCTVHALDTSDTKKEYSFRIGM
jgi:hydrogenase large subunit